MFCPKHPNLFADKKCHQCSKWFCYLCTKVINNNTVCSECAQKGCFFSFSDETDLKEPKPHINISNLQYQVSASLAGQGMIVPWKQKPAVKKIACAYHSYKEAIKKCSKCNRMVCKDCLRVDDNVDTICYTCWYKMPVSGEELPDDETDDIDEDMDFNSIKEGLPPELAKLLEEESISEEIEVNDKKNKIKENRSNVSVNVLKDSKKNLIAAERKKRIVKPLIDSGKSLIKHDLKNLSDKSLKNLRDIPVEYETNTPSLSAKPSGDMSQKHEQKTLPGQSKKDIKENAIYERGLFQNNQKESWFTNLNFAGEDYDPHKNEESSEKIITGVENKINKELSEHIQHKTENKDFIEESDNIEIKTDNIEQINTYFHNILQAIESPAGEEEIAGNEKISPSSADKSEKIHRSSKIPEEIESKEEEKGSHKAMGDMEPAEKQSLLSTGEQISDEEIDLSEIDDILASEEGFIEGDFDLSEIDELLENAEKEKLHSDLEDFILSDNLLSTSEHHKKNEKEEFISKFNSENVTVSEKKDILEQIGKIQDSNVTEYIGNIVLHDDHKELRIKAAEILVERMDESGLDYLMTGIKNETDSDVRKFIALSYSKLKYKK
ncbi:MAG: HEAT repeat domain-containing protein [Candidatus Eremiobacterota bacterium]